MSREVFIKRLEEIKGKIQDLSGEMRKEMENKSDEDKMRLFAFLSQYANDRIRFIDTVIKYEKGNHDENNR